LSNSLRSSTTRGRRMFKVIRFRVDVCKTLKDIRKNKKYINRLTRLESRR